MNLLILFAWLQGVITSLAVGACIQAVSVLAIKQLRWFQSQNGKQQQLTAAYGNEAEHLQTKADKTIAATFSLSEHCDIYIVIYLKKNSLLTTYKLHTLSKKDCKTHGFMSLCKETEKTEKWGIF